MPAGRPSTYDAAYCEQVIECGRNGYSIVQISAEIDVPRATMTRWADEHPEFRAALTRAKELEQAWWERRGVDALDQPVFQSQVWKTSMQARFRNDYTERREHSGPDGGAIKTESTGDASDIARKLAFLLLGGPKDDASSN